MSSRLDPEPAVSLVPLEVPVAAQALAPTPIAFDPDAELGHALPSDHPAWAKDTISVSMRARALFERLRPLAMRAMTFWDHHVRSIVVSGNRITIDASGSYRLE